MPVYCYRREDTDQLVERVCTCQEKDLVQKVDENGKHYIILDNGVRAFRDIATEQRGARSFPGNWPQYCDAVGVGDGQQKEAYEDSVKMGVPTRFDSEGRAEFLSRAHRKRYCEAYGFFDKSGGYGDPQKGGRR